MFTTSDWIDHDGSGYPFEDNPFVEIETVSVHFCDSAPREARDFCDPVNMGGDQWGTDCHPEARIARYRIVAPSLLPKPVIENGD